MNLPVRGFAIVVEGIRIPVATFLPALMAGLADDRVRSGHRRLKNVGDSLHGIALENCPSSRCTNYGTVLAGVEDVGGASGDVALKDGVSPERIGGRHIQVTVKGSLGQA